MKTLNIITLAISLAAAALSVYVYRQPPKKWLPEVKATPQQLAEAAYKEDHGFIMSYGDRIFREDHESDIAKSLIVSDIETSTDNQIALVFVRFEAAGKKFREAFWTRNIGKGWVYEYVSTYKSDKIVEKNKEWVEKMEKKKEEWESSSASVYE